MERIQRALERPRWLTFLTIMFVALIAMSFSANQNVSANHPVLVEGNCDSPVPGTVTIVGERGSCGDYDGDGRVGTAEDTDGADRIFGTITAALGPGTGAAAGTGANMNGTITIVTSGRFAESLTITPEIGTGIGNVILQAAPGVEAQIDAVLQGDSAGGNNARQGQVGITITSGGSSNVTLRNLTIRNWMEGVRATRLSRVIIDNCRIENNVNYGVRAMNNASVTIYDSHVNMTGYRVGTTGTCPASPCVPAPGHAIAFEDASSGAVAKTVAANNYNAALSNTSAAGPGGVRYRDLVINNNGAVVPIVNATRADF